MIIDYVAIKARKYYCRNITKLTSYMLKLKP